MNKENKLVKLSVGSRFEFRNVIWEVIEAYRYDWEEDDSSIEFKIKAGVQTAYLELEYEDEEDDQLTINFSTDIDFDELKPAITLDKFTGEEVLSLISYLSSDYELKEIDEGLFTDLSGKESPMEFTNFCYYYNDFFVNIAIYEDDSIECSTGEEIDIDMISHIQLTIS